MISQILMSAWIIMVDALTTATIQKVDITALVMMDTSCLVINYVLM